MAIVVLIEALDAPGPADLRLPSESVGKVSFELSSTLITGYTSLGVFVD